MGAPKGNKYAKGNKGGGLITTERELVYTFKKLALNEMIRVMKSDDEKYKKELILRMGTSVIPRDLNIGGDEENPLRVIQVQVLNEATIQ